jgi:hypothetical protein
MINFKAEVDAQATFVEGYNIKIIFEQPIDRLTFDNVFMSGLEFARIDTERQITGAGLEWKVPVSIYGEGAVLLGINKEGVSTAPIFVNVKKQSLCKARPSGYDSANWMKRLADSTPIIKISMPGTHDSATYGVTDLDLPIFFRCQYQSKNITTQLNDGIRFFDLRVGSDGKLHHDYVICFDSYPNYPVTIEKVFDNIISFLNNHRTETVVVIIKHEYGNSESDYLKYVKAAIDKYNKDGEPKRVYTGSSIDIKLSEVRGKIVLLDGGGNLGWGIKASAMHGGGWGNVDRIYWQNFYDIGDSSMSPDKRAALKAHEILVFNENIVKYSFENLFCFNWWNKKCNFGTSVLYYAGKIESYFYGKWNGKGKVYYPQGVQIMDYYNNDLVYEVIESNWNV